MHRFRHWIWALILAGTLANGGANVQEIKRLGFIEQRQTEIQRQATTCANSFAYFQSQQPALGELMMTAGDARTIGKALQRGGQSEQHLIAFRDTLIEDATRVVEIGGQPRQEPLDEATARAAEEQINNLIDRLASLEDERRRREKPKGEELLEFAGNLEKAAKAVGAVMRIAGNEPSHGRPPTEPHVT